MKRSFPPALAFSAIATLAFACSACQQGSDEAGNAYDAGGIASNAAAAAPAAETNATPMGPAEAEEAAGNATGPVAMASDAQLPQSCQAYVREVQACLDRGGGSNPMAQPNALRRSLHRYRIGAWPGWARAGMLESGCAGQLTELNGMC